MLQNMKFRDVIKIVEAGGGVCTFKTAASVNISIRPSLARSPLPDTLARRHAGHGTEYPETSGVEMKYAIVYEGCHRLQRLRARSAWLRRGRRNAGGDG